MKQVLLNLVLSAVVVMVGLTFYDREVLRPSLRIGLIDVAEVYRLKEREFTELITKAKGEADRTKAFALAEEFAKALPEAMDALPRECRCLVLLKSSVVAASANTVDLTDLLKRKVGIQQ